MSPNTTLIKPLATGIYVTKHNSDSDTRNMDICHQAQLLFSHYQRINIAKHNSVFRHQKHEYMSPSTTLIQPLVTGIHVTKYNADSDTRNSDICHQIQLLFSHYKQGYISPSATLIQTLGTGIYIAKHNSVFRHQKQGYMSPNTTLIQTS